MTTLDRYTIKDSGILKGYTVTKTIAGDLSFSYAVRPNEYVTEEYLMGVGISFNKLADIPELNRLLRKYGYDKTQEIWMNKIRTDNDYRFGYIRGKEARKYARHPYAYGKYAEKIRRKK